MSMSTTVRLPRAERREQLLRAAASAFLRGGFDGTSMDEVARSAGVTRLIVYRVFETKERLYDAVLQDVVDDLRDAFEHRDALPDRRRSVVAILLDVARRHPDGFRLLWRHAINEPAFTDRVVEIRDRVDDVAQELIAGAVADPVLRRWAASSLVAFVHESICRWIDDGDASRDHEVLEMLTDGVRSTVATWASRSAPISG